MVPHRLSEELWRTKTFSIFSWMAMWDCSIVTSAGWGCLPLARCTTSSTTCWIESSTWEVRLCEQQRLTSEGGNIFFGISCRDTHHITGGCFVLAFEFSICDNHSLLAFNNIRMDPHCLSSRSRNRDKTIRPFSFWLWGSILITLSSSFGMRTTLVGAGRRFQLN